ncbi:MAG: hypothetical protein AAB356_08870, partial [Deltaproteobacteria bacterium]
MQAFIWGNRWRDNSDDLPGLMTGTQLAVGIGIAVVSAIIAPGAGLAAFSFNLSLSQFATAAATVCVMQGGCSEQGAMMLAMAITVGAQMGAGNLLAGTTLAEIGTDAALKKGLTGSAEELLKNGVAQEAMGAAVRDKVVKFMAGSVASNIARGAAIGAAMGWAQYEVAVYLDKQIVDEDKGGSINGVIKQGIIGIASSLGGSLAAGAFSFGIDALTAGATGMTASLSAMGRGDIKDSTTVKFVDVMKGIIAASNLGEQLFVIGVRWLADEIKVNGKSLVDGDSQKSQAIGLIAGALYRHFGTDPVAKIKNALAGQKADAAGKAAGEQKKNDLLNENPQRSDEDLQEAYDKAYQKTFAAVKAAELQNLAYKSTSGEGLTDEDIKNNEAYNKAIDKELVAFYYRDDPQIAAAVQKKIEELGLDGASLLPGVLEGVRAGVIKELAAQYPDDASPAGKKPLAREEKLQRDLDGRRNELVKILAQGLA